MQKSIDIFIFKIKIESSTLFKFPTELVLKKLGDNKWTYITGTCTTVVFIMHRGHGCECRIYAQLVVMYLFIGIKYLRGGGGRCECMRVEEDIVKVVSR